MKENFLKNPFLLGPMAGFTDAGFRSICLDCGAGLVETEMVSTKGLVYGSENTRELLFSFGEYDRTAVQLFGSEPDFFARALEMPCLSQFKAIGINMGCPMQKVVKTGAGSALLNNPKLASEIIKTVVKHSNNRPVMVKFRIGWDEGNIVACDFAKMCEDSGASLITVHGRTREQMYLGKSNWDVINDVAKAVSIDVIGNGDIRSASEASFRLNNTAVSGVAIARGALGNPWIFADCTNTDYKLTPLETIEKHYNLLLEILPESRVVPLMRGHLNFYLKHLKLGAKLRDQLNRENDLQNLIKILKNCIN